MSWWSDKLSGNKPAPVAPPPMYAAAPVISVPQSSPVSDNGQAYVPKVKTLGAQLSNTRCPECGSPNYGSRHLATRMAGTSGAGGRVTNLKTGQVAQVAETCFDCGHNTVFAAQFGSAGGDGGAIANTREVPISGHARTAGIFTTGPHTQVVEESEGGAGRITQI